MNADISVIKGIHPGKILERELKKRNLPKGQFALSVNEFPQTLVAIMKGKRRMNAALSLKIEKALEIEEGYFLILQSYYDLELEKKKQAENHHPDLSILRPVVFWDTDINRIDWEKCKSAVIKRIFERGNEQEVNEIIRFYGEDIVLSTLTISESTMPAYRENKK